MKEVILNIRTNKIGSDVQANTGYSQDEWESLSDEERDEITSEIVWEAIEVWETVE